MLENVGKLRDKTINSNIDLYQFYINFTIKKQ